MKNLKDLKTEFNNITLFKIFEEKVINKKTNEIDYIIFEISIDGNNLIAMHTSLTEEEENSNKIAFKSIELDDCFSLDENLQELHEECIDAILNSDFYNLK